MKTRGQELMLEETMQQIRSAKVDVQTAKAMEDANNVIDKLQQQVGVERFEEIMEKHKELETNKEEIQELMKEYGVKEDDVEDEIEALEAELVAEEMGSIPNNKIEGKHSYPLFSPS